MRLNQVLFIFLSILYCSQLYATTSTMWTPIVTTETPDLIASINTTFTRPTGIRANTVVTENVQALTRGGDIFIKKTLSPAITLGDNSVTHKKQAFWQQITPTYRIGNIPSPYTAHGSNTEIEADEMPTKRGRFFTDAAIAAFWLIVELDPELFLVVWTSLKVSLLAVFFASVIGIPLGIIVGLNTFRSKTFLLACLNTLMALPTVVVGLLLYGFINRQGILGEYGLLYTQAAIVIGQCILIVPVVWNLSIAAVNAADPRLARTCSALGASFMQRCLIYMGEVRFALIAAVVAGFGRAVGEVGIAMMLGGNIAGLTRTMTTAIALETSKGEFEFALSLGFMLLLAAFLVNGILQQFQIRKCP